MTRDVQQHYLYRNVFVSFLTDRIMRCIRNSVHVFHMATIHQYDMIVHNFNRLHVWTGLFVIHGSVHLACLTLTRVLDSGCESSEDRTTLTQELCSSERDRTGTRLPFVCKTHGKEWRRETSEGSRWMLIGAFSHVERDGNGTSFIFNEHIDNFTDVQ